MRLKTTVLAALAASSAAVLAGAFTAADVIQPTTTLVYALGWLMLTVLGIKWIVAESTQERLDAKKGMIYIVIGLLVVRVICNLIAFYCQAAQSSVGVGFSCASAAIGC